jgi:hypothetical protein
MEKWMWVCHVDDGAGWLWVGYSTMHDFIPGEEVVHDKLCGYYPYYDEKEGEDRDRAKLHKLRVRLETENPEGHSMPEAILAAYAACTGDSPEGYTPNRRCINGYKHVLSCKWCKGYLRAQAKADPFVVGN